MRNPNVIFDVRKLLKTFNNFHIANQYQRNNQVQSFVVEANNRYFHVEGVVEDDYGEEHVEFDYDHYGNLVSYDCTCSFCSPDIPCAHIGAILFEMNETDIGRLPYKYEKKLTPYEVWYRNYLEQQREREEFIRKQREEAERQRRLQEIEDKKRETEMLIQVRKVNHNTLIEGNIDPNKYIILPEMNHEGGSYYLTYKIGTPKKTFVLRGISKFLEQFTTNNTVQYSKTLTIVHDEERFDEFAQQQIRFFEKANAIFINHEYEYVHQYHAYPINKGLELHKDYIGLWSAFYRTYNDRDDVNFVFAPSLRKLDLELDDQGDYYTLRCSNDDFAVDGNHIFYYPDEVVSHYVFEVVRLDPSGQTQKLIRHILNNGQILIEKNQWDGFYQYLVTPCLKYIEILGKLPEKSKTFEYDKIEVFGDINDHDEIEVKVQYIGKDLSVTPAFQPEMVLDFNQSVVEGAIRKYGQIVPGQGIAFFDSAKDETVQFLTEGIERIRPYCDIYVSDALRNLNVKAKYNITVGVRVENDLLALDISSMEIPQTEMSQVLASYRRKKRFHRLKNGTILSLDSKELQELEELVDHYHIDSKSLNDGKVHLNKYRMFDMDEQADEIENVVIHRQESFNDLLHEFKEIQPSDIPIPEGYETILRDYQKEGYRWMYTLNQYGFNGILADDMGLGKTLQVIALLEGLNSDLPSIVICPASLVYNWEDEVHKFSKKLRVGCVVGNKSQRKGVIMQRHNYDLLVTSYDYIRRDMDMYQDLNFNYVILDEAQYIKNQKTKNATAVKSLNALHRLALTGTPIENTLAELWSIFDFLMPDYLYNYHYFKGNYETPIVKNNQHETSQKLRRMVSPFILRRNKKDVLTELPDKVESVQVIPFNEEENKLYLAHLAKANQELQAMFKMDTVDNIAILALLTRLRQLCIEPRMVYENIEQPSSKMEALFERLEQLKESNQKTLVFSAFPSVFELILPSLDERHLTYFMLTGQTSREERREMVERFQKGEVDVFLISLKAGGTGLNLTAASAVIHIDPWWNLSAQNQATDRAHRFGQEKNVQVIKLVMKNSIEERIVKLQERKKELADLFVENNQGSIASMSKAEIIDLFKA